MVKITEKTTHPQNDLKVHFSNPILKPGKRYYKLMRSLRPYCKRKGRVISFNYILHELIQRTPRQKEAIKQLQKMGFSFQQTF